MLRLKELMLYCCHDDCVLFTVSYLAAAVEHFTNHQKSICIFLGTRTLL